MVTDVPIGVLLSGGIDSSIVAAIAARLSSEPIRTFTATFPGHTSHNEAPYARRVASYFGTKHTELPVESATIDLLPILAAQFDEPMCDSSMIPTYLVSRLIRQQATVALGGDGADELFGGYPTYQRALSVAAVQGWLPQLIRYPISRAAESLLPLGMRGRSYLTSLEGTATRAVSQLSVSFDRRSRQKLVPSLCSNDTRGGTPERYKQGICQSARGLPGLAMALDFHTYLSSDILVKIDRASMLASLEVRAPFLDRNIIEFAFQKVPNSLRANRGSCKILLRIIAERLLPDQLDLTRKKQGFAVPMGKWLTGDFGKLTQEILRDADSQLFNRREITRLLDGQSRGLSHTERLFGITMFELWRRHYNIAVA